METYIEYISVLNSMLYISQVYYCIITTHLSFASPVLV